jgi:hypothetical protein
LPAQKHDFAVILSLSAAALLGGYLLLTSTWSPRTGIWPYDLKRILEFGLLFVLPTLPLFNLPIRKQLGSLLRQTPLWMKLTLAAVFLAGVLSALLHARSLMHALNSLSEVALFFLLAASVYVVGACRRIGGKTFDQVAVGLLALTAIAVGMQELIGVAAATAGGVEFNFRISLMHFSWPRFYNQVQSWAVPLTAALPLLFTKRRLLAVIGCGLALGLNWYVILMTGARGSFVAIAGAVTFAVIFLPPVRTRLLIWQLAGFSLGALVFTVVLLIQESAVVTPSPETTGNEKPAIERGIREADEGAGKGLEGGESSFFKQSIGRPMTHTSGRSWMWKTMLHESRDDRLLGIGPMNLVCTAKRRLNHPHNFPVQLAGEWGWPVALAVAALFLALLFRLSSAVRASAYGSSGDTVLAGLLLASTVSAALHACLSGVMVMPASQVAGLLICGMLLGLAPVPESDRGEPARRGMLACATLLAAALLTLGAHELGTMQQRSVQLEPDDRMWPRMWQDAMVCRLYVPPTKVTN